MKISKISKDSIDTKLKIIDGVRNIITTTTSDVLNRGVIIRGERSMMLDFGLGEYIKDPAIMHHLCELTKVSEESKKSFHQADYLIFTRLSSFYKKEIAGDEIPPEDKNPEGMDKIFKKIAEEHKKEAPANMSLLFF